MLRRLGAGAPDEGGRVRREMDIGLLERAKVLGFSDRQLAVLAGRRESEIRELRAAHGLAPAYRLVDTCAAEFEARTPYYYSSWDRGEDEVIESGDPKIMILGGGPNRIGQGIEFDYCCVHASYALREDGYQTLMINSNPETVSTDYDTSDRLYFEPLTLEDVLHVYQREGCQGAIVQFGGQTPLNLARGLEENGVRIIGTSPRSIEMAEDRELFAGMLRELGIPQPPNRIATDVEGALAAARELEYPVLVRPSFVLGGRAMQIVYSDAKLEWYMQHAVEASPERPVLIDRFLENAVEVDVDCISDAGQEGRDGEGTVVVGGMLEHIEFAGVHSGDAAMVLPPPNLSGRVIGTIREYTHAMARRLGIVGLMNVQYAVKDDKVHVLEVNPRASRTVPFVSKAIGTPLAKLAARVMAGRTLAELGLVQERRPRYWAVKESVFPFNRFPGQDILLSPEMKSTGEVMGIDADLGCAFGKSQLAAGCRLPLEGNLFLSVNDEDKSGVAELAREFDRLGFRLISTPGTAAVLQEAGLEAREIYKVSEGRPNALDLLLNEEIDLVINTPSGQTPRDDEVRIRSTLASTGIPVITTMSSAQATASAISFFQKHGYSVRTLQEFHRSLAQEAPDGPASAGG